MFVIQWINMTTRQRQYNFWVQVIDACIQSANSIFKKKWILWRIIIGGKVLGLEAKWAKPGKWIHLEIRSRGAAFSRVVQNGAPIWKIVHELLSLTVTSHKQLNRPRRLIWLAANTTWGVDQISRRPMFKERVNILRVKVFGLYRARLNQRHSSINLHVELNK